VDLFLAGASLCIIHHALHIPASAPVSVVVSFFVHVDDAGGLGVLHDDVLLRGVDVGVSRVDVVISDIMSHDVEASGTPL